MTRLTTDEEMALLCAANNADFYQAIFRALKLPDRRDSDLWSSEALAPPYYSNLTTLAPDADARQLTEILRLRAMLGRPFSLKDGFCRLDLGDYGFEVLFSAEWIWAERTHLMITSQPRWEQICDADALSQWEQSWRMGGSATNLHVFAPALLDDEDIAIFGRSTEDGFDGGCIANRSAHVVGISNIFHLKGTSPAYGEAVSVAASAFGANLPLVGYDRGEALSEMEALGFRSVGNLRIWLSD